jgi:hypothetical protein
MFETSSRYASVDDAAIDIPEADGTIRTIRYKRRRFLPRPDSLTVVAAHVMTDGDRLDLVAARYAGDPTAFWRLCDGSDLLRPEELERPGRIVDIVMARP